VPAATVDAEAALGRFKAGRPDGAARRNPVLARLANIGSAPSLGGLGWRRPAAAGLVAVCLAATMAFTPLASTIQRIFAPSQITPTSVSITQSDVEGLKTFSTWGDGKTLRTPELGQADSAAQAAKTSGLPAIHVDPNALPGSLATAPVSYGTVGQGAAAVTFNGKAPAKLQGTTLTMQYGPGEVAVYGNLAKAISGARAGAGEQNGSAPAPGGPDQGQGAAGSQQEIQQAVNAIGPIVGVAEMHAPKVTSNGASLQDIKQALLAQPNLSPSLRSAIEQFNSPVGNLPIPIPADMTTAQSVTVQNVKGTLIGDNTGLGAGVIWIKHGIVYAVAGTITTDQALAIANSL
jgi:hypothetical protein